MSRWILVVVLTLLCLYSPSAQELRHVTEVAIATSEKEALRKAQEEAVGRVIKDVLAREKMETLVPSPKSLESLQAKLLLRGDDFVIGSPAIIAKSREFVFFTKIEAEFEVAEGDIVAEVRRYKESMRKLSSQQLEFVLQVDASADMDMAKHGQEIMKFCHSQLTQGFTVDQLGTQRFLVTLALLAPWDIESDVRKIQILTQSLEFRLLASPKVGGIVAEEEEQRYAEAKNKGAEVLATYYQKLHEKGFAWFPVVKSRMNISETEYLLWLQDGYNIASDSFARFYETTSDYDFGKILGFELKESRKEAFGQMTEKYHNEKLAIVFNRQIVATPVIKGRIQGTGILVGFSPEMQADLQELLSVTEKLLHLDIVRQNFMPLRVGDDIPRGVLIHVKLTTVVTPATIAERLPKTANAQLVPSDNDACELLLRLPLTKEQEPTPAVLKKMGAEMQDMWKNEQATVGEITPFMRLQR
jgi:hypothetical protein